MSKMHIWDRGYRLDELGSGNYEDEFLVVSGKDLEPVAIVAHKELADYVVNGANLVAALEACMYSIRALDDDYDTRDSYIQAQNVLDKLK